MIKLGLIMFRILGPPATPDRGMTATPAALGLETVRQIGDHCIVMAVPVVPPRNLDRTARHFKPTGIPSAILCLEIPPGARKPCLMRLVGLEAAGIRGTFEEGVVEGVEDGETIAETVEGIGTLISEIEGITRTAMNVAENVTAGIGETVIEIILGDGDHHLADDPHLGGTSGIDGPLSAGSSSSDPPFGPSSYRGGYNSRGRGRGRGDWDRGRGRGFYDDRDRYGPGFRSRSQEGRYRDRDDRDRDSRYLDADLRSRDPRDDRDVRDREVRPKLDRTSHEPPPQPAKDVSPPPVAPAAPSFGSVPNRSTSVADIGSATGKVPPTGPRALKEERPVPTGSTPNADARLPPIGPSRSSFLEISSPAIPSGPRSQTRPGPSSKQWINPNIKNRVPESPKLNRSQSFAQPRSAGLRSDEAHSNTQGETNQRPHSSDAKSEPQLSSADRQLRDSHMADGEEEAVIHNQRPQSAGSSLDRGHKPKDITNIAKDETGATERADNLVGKSSILETRALPMTNETNANLNRRPTLKVLARRISIPQKEAQPLILDQSSESDDEEIGEVIETRMTEVESKLKRFEGIEDVPIDVISRHAIISLEAIANIMNEPEGLEEMVGPIPDGVSLPGKTIPEPEPQAKMAPSVGESKGVESTNVVIKDKTPPLVGEEQPLKAADTSAELPQPSIEQDIDMTAPQELLREENKAENDDGDVAMEDALGPSQPDSEVQPPAQTQRPTSRKQSANPPPFEKVRILSQEISKRGSSAPSGVGEDEDETDIEDVDLQTIEVVREHMATPPIDSLPYFDAKPWFKDDAFLKSMDAPQPSLKAFILERLKDEGWTRRVEEDQMKKRYESIYDHYLRFTMSEDPIAVKSREKFTCVSRSAANGQKPGFHESKPEGTRRSRYASERDLERILEESRRVEDEKRERQMQAERERYRTEKEAVLPRQYQVPEERENAFYRDVTGFIQAEKIVAAWQLLPPVDNFTEEETAIFEKAYLEFPKQWGRVADPLPNRDFGTSIQFYYLKKEKAELNLKEKLKKRPRQRKKGGRGKQRSSALVSELGNGENENEETQDTGENGERRRPRRAAAPTFNSEATPATDGEAGTPAGTPGRRGAGAKGDGGTERPERKPRGRRAAKDKEPKQPRVNQTLAAAPPASTKGSRSRSSSQVHGPEWVPPQAQGEAARVPTQYELAPNTAAVPPVGIPAPFPPAQPIPSPERSVPAPPPPPPPVSMSDAMAPPPLRPEPPQQPPVSVLDLEQTTVSDRRSGTQASSYWSVPEANDFPQLLRSFGSDWAAIATHMRTKTPVMVKNYYIRKKDVNDWEGIVKEADNRKRRGEKRPAPPIPSSGVKKRYESSSNRPLAAADTSVEDTPPPKVEHPPATQPTTGRFNVPIAAQPQPTLIPSTFVPVPQPPLIQGHTSAPPGSQPLVQPVTQTMSPGTRPIRAPLPFVDREREPPTQPRVSLSQKPSHPAPPPPPEPLLRHPLPTSLVESQPERPKAEPKGPKEQPRFQERQQLRVKQEPDLTLQYDHFTAQAQVGRMAPSRPENLPLSRPPEPPRAVAPAPQVPFASILQQPQHGRNLLSESNPSPPTRPRPISNLSRPTSRASGGPEPFSAPPAQPTPPTITPTPPRPPERKTSNLMALLNDDPPPPPPKRVTEVPTVTKPSSTPPLQTNLSRPPPPPPPPSHIRRESAVSEAQGYGYGRNPPPAPSAMPSLKPYTSGSPQTQPLTVPRHMALDATTDQYYGSRPRSFPSSHPPTNTSSPQSAHHYPLPNQPPQMPYQPQTSYPYGAQVPLPNAASPPPQYGGHPSAPRGHDPAQPSRDVGWPGPHQGHHLQPSHQPPPPQPPAWASHPPQLPKSTQPPPTQSAWAAQHAPAPKPPPPSSSVPPQPSWATAPPPPRGHDPMALRDVRDVYPPPRMQATLQAQYTSASRAPEPPPPTALAGYPRYASTPVPGRDPRDPGPPRSYTPVSAYDNRSYPPPPSQDIREAQLREQQQQSILQQQLRPQDSRHLYDRPPDRYGR
ncbi:hypothetical protein AAE478_005855 [Parahypoxylon ruwenzoriense]